MLTGAFVSVLGEQVRPFTFVIIEEMQRKQFGIAGRSMPDPQWLIGDEYKAVLERREQTEQE
jgi:4-oxalocrotonate tautomerase